MVVVDDLVSQFVLTLDIQDDDLKLPQMSVRPI